MLCALSHIGSPSPAGRRLLGGGSGPRPSYLDEDRGDLEPAEALAGVKSVKQMDRENDFTAQQDDGTIEIPPPQVVELGRPEGAVTGGDW